MNQRDLLWHRVLHALRSRPDWECIDAVAAVAADVLTPRRCEVVITARTPGDDFSPGYAHVVAATASWAREVDVLQSAVGDGPAVTAVSTGMPAVAADQVGLARQWPALAAMMPSGAAGVIAAFPVASDSAAFATVTAYQQPSPSVGASGETVDLAVGVDLAVLAAVALTEHAAEHVGRIESSPADDTVNIAVGILVARHGLSTSDAAAVIRAAAFGQGRSPQQIADDIITGRRDTPEL